MYICGNQGRISFRPTLSGTRHFDGYVPSMRDLIDEDSRLSKIDLLLTEISEKIFLLDQSVPSEYSDAMKKIHERFRFLAKFIQDHYGKKKFPVMNPDSIFISLIKPYIRDPWMKQILDKNLHLDSQYQETIIDKLLVLYSSTKSKLVKIIDDFRTLYASSINTHASDAEFYKNPNLRFYKYLSGCNILSPKNMSDFIYGKIIHHNKDLSYMLFKRVLTRCIAREKAFISSPSIDTFPTKKAEKIAIKRKETFKINLNLLNQSICELVADKPYKEQVARVFAEALAVI